MNFTDIIRLTNHSLVQERYKLFLEICNECNGEYPNMNYLGLNFQSNRISSIKIYFSFFQRLSRKDIEAFIPTTDDFYKYYHLWRPTKFRSLGYPGCTFSIKFKDEDTPTFGFHLRLENCDEANILIGRSVQLPFDSTILTNPGINFEYHKNRKTIVRKYFYLTHPAHKYYVSLRFLNKNARYSKLCELAEYNDKCKINIWPLAAPRNNSNRINYLSDYADGIVQKLSSEYGLSNVSEGFYENDDIVATYFFNLKKNDLLDPFEDSENFSIDTIKSLLLGGIHNV